MTNDVSQGDAPGRAVGLFANGHNCAQAVLGAVAPRLGLDQETAVRLATGFGVGLSMGETCGAVSGAVMALGLAHGGGGPDATAAKLDTYALAGEFLDVFAREHGSLRCRVLIGCDPSTPEGLRLAKAEGRFTTVCTRMVASAVAIVAAMLDDRSATG